MKLVRAFERGEHPKVAEDVPDMDEFAKQLLSRAPGGVPTNFYRAAIEDTTIITMKGVSLTFLPLHADVTPMLGQKWRQQSGSNFICGG